MQTVEELEKELKALEEQEAAKLKAKADAAKLPAMMRERDFRKAKLDALDKFTPDELFECDVKNVGPCLFHWPDEITYNHFMKGPLKGDLSKVTIEQVEDLVRRCAIFPAPQTMLEELRKKNPHARSVIQDQLFKRMKDQLDEEGKK